MSTPSSTSSSACWGGDVASCCARCGAELRDPAPCARCLLAGELPAAALGDHLELLDVIGEGGMGTVFRARDARLDRMVAVKVLPPELTGAPGAAERLSREARTLAMLSHPNIVAVHELGEADGQGYIVMELIDGRPLSALLPLPIDRALDVAIAVCDALVFAHARGVVHRDIKPDNILIAVDGRVKVADFGIARLAAAAGGGGTVTAVGAAIGTPVYMAPEALAGAPPDPRADIYSVGAVIYEMITGTPPLGDFASLPGALDCVVRKALAPRPEQRQPDTEALRAALARLRGVPDAPEAELPPDERHWMWGTAVTLAIATAVALWAFVVSVTPRVIRADEIQPLVMVGAERLEDGRILTRARFEVWWTLAAAGAVAFAFLAYGLLVRHWRLSGLERRRPDQRVAESRVVLGLGVGLIVMYVGRIAIVGDTAAGLGAVLPVLGGLGELVMLCFAWFTMLELRRNRRPPWREWRMWLGGALAVTAPALELLRFLQRASPG
jgi:serine/threonine-protein kinase